MGALAVLNVIIWAPLTWIGWDWIQDVQSRNVAGYPSSEQVAFYFYTPLFVLLLVPLAYSLGRFTRLRRTALLLHVLPLVFFLPFLAAYGGGV